MKKYIIEQVGTIVIEAENEEEADKIVEEDITWDDLEGTCDIKEIKE